MKKHLLRTLFVALMVMIGANAWADNYFTQDYEGDGVTADWTSGNTGRYTVDMKTTEDPANTYLTVNAVGNGNNGATITSTSVAGKVANDKDFTMEFDLQITNGNNQASSFYIYDSANDAAKAFFALVAPSTGTKWNIQGSADHQVELAKSTWYTFKIAKSAGITYLTLTNKATGDKLKDQAIIPTLSEAGGLGNMVFNTKRYYAYMAIDNVVVRDVESTDAPASTPTTYTLKYVDGNGTPLKEDVIINSIVGIEVTASSDQIADFKTGEGENQKKWIYVSGNNSITTVEAAESNVITLVFREAEKFNYTFTAKSGDILLETYPVATGFELDNIKVPYHHYYFTDGKIYQKGATSSEYNYSFVLDSNNKEVGINDYAILEKDNVIFFAEAENLKALTPITDGLQASRNSFAAGAFASEYVPFITLTPGTYTLTAAGYGGTYSFMNGETPVLNMEQAGYWREITSEEFTLETSTDITFKGGVGATGALDYIYIQSTNGSAKEYEKPFDPATLIANASFEADGEKVASNGALELTGWTFAGVGTQFNNTELRPAESASTTSQFGHSTPKDGNYSLFFRNGWNGTGVAVTLTSDAMEELPAGSYKLSVAYKQHYSHDGSANNNTHVALALKNGETTIATVKSPAATGVQGANGDATYFNDTEWSTLELPFTMEEAVTGAQVVITLNAAGQRRSDFFIDDVKLVQVSALDLALIDLKAAIDAAKAKLASYPVGDVYFTYPASEIAGLAILIGIAEGTYSAAKSVEAVKEATKNLNDYVATFKPIMQIPTEGKAYYIANKTAEGNLCIGTEKVTIAKDAAVFFTKAEGGFVLSNEEGNYIFKTTTAGNTWTLSTTANKDEAYVVNFNLVDGAYTIQGANGLFGTDNTTEGSAVYANKTQANNGLWTITAVPEFKPSYGTLWADGETTTDENENTIITLDNKYFKDFVKVGDTIRVAITNVGTQPASSRRVIHDGKIALVSGDAEQIEDGIALGATGVDFTFNEEQLTAIQAGNNVQLVYSYLTVTQVELTEMKKEQLIDNGTYYIAAAEKITSDNPTYMAAGNAWGTHGIVNNAGLDLDVTYNTASKDYYIDTRISNGGDNHYLGSGLYMDAPAFGWKIEEVTNGFNIYGMFDGVKQYISAATDGNLVLSENPYPWIFIHISNWNSVMKDVHESILNAATVENPADATFLLKDANFNRNDLRWEAWTVSKDCGNKNLGGGCSETNGNGCAESYKSTFTISQIAEGAPKGIYAVTAQGFYRQEVEGDFALPYFFANDEKANFLLRTGTENSMTDAGVSFTNGLYTIDPIYVEVAENGTLTVGTKSETDKLWCIWDNFKLTYYGANATMDEVKNGAIVKELADLRAKAQNMLADIEVDAVKNAINDALTATADVTGADAINAAIATMKAAIEKGEASIIAKNVLPKMKQLTEETNLYTAEALNTYYTQWEVKYLDGSLTKTEASALQNPFLVTGWHASITCDNFLLSAWDTNPDFQDAPYYINTWSVEGETDGSEFKVPFFEYWTGDGESLGARTLTATMLEQQNGAYNVSVLVRVRMKNGAEAPATGITLQVNDGEAVDVTTGNQIGTSQFYMGEFTAKGAVENGELNIKFNILNTNNISWLSFKNVKFALSTDPADGIQSIDNNLLPKSIYNLNGQKVQKATKGLYIINGKKVIKK